MGLVMFPPHMYAQCHIGTEHRELKIANNNLFTPSFIEIGQLGNTGTNTSSGVRPKAC